MNLRHPARVIDLGRRPFDDVWALQLELVEARRRDAIVDTLLLVEHPEVITLGRSTKPENVLPAARAVPMFEIERGGDVTFHGPGQLVAYPILALRDGERDLHRYLRAIEDAAIETAAAFGVAADRVAGKTGVWTTTTPPRKLASIGIAVKRGWITLHGVALNVATDLARFALINPCGFDAAVMTSLAAESGAALTLDDVKPAFVRASAAALDRGWAI